MNDNLHPDVTEAFDLLAQKLEAEIALTHQAGVRAFEGRLYSEAREAASRAEGLGNFRQQFQLLRQEWQNLVNGVADPSTAAGGPPLARPAETPASGQPAAPVTHPAPPPADSQGASPTSKWSTTTPEQEFQGPILAALAALGGTAKKNDVLERVAQLMQGALTPVDCCAIRGGDPNVPLWRVTADSAKRLLVGDGLIKVDPAPKGLWELTDQGREAVKKGHAA